MMRIETWGWVGLFGAAVLLAGCGPALGEDGARWCTSACAPGVVASCQRDRVECHPADGACSVDRLLVTPVPPGRKVAAREASK